MELTASSSCASISVMRAALASASAFECLSAAALALARSCSRRLRRVMSVEIPHTPTISPASLRTGLFTVQ